MYHLNEYMKEEGNWVEKLAIKALWQHYSANSIKDLEENKSSLIATKTLLFPGCMFNGYSVIAMQNDYLFEWENEKEGFAWISDVSSKLPVIAKTVKNDGKTISWKINRLENKIKIYDPMLEHHVETNMTYLSDFQVFGPSSSSSEEEKNDFEINDSYVFG